MKVLIVYYSLYGHVYELSKAVESGVRSVDQAEAVIRRVPEFQETLDEINKNDHAKAAWEKQKDIPICTTDDLRNADAVLFGTPTRFGNMTAQMKRLFDGCAGLWMDGAMEGKPAGIFVSTATTHGGQETTILSMTIPILHLGMILVGVPYSTPGMLHTEGRGGTPYGASTVAGTRNELQPAKEDLDIAGALGKRVAEICKKLKS